MVFLSRNSNLKFVMQKTLDESQLLFDILMQKYFG